MKHSEGVLVPAHFRIGAALVTIMLALGLAAEPVHAQTASGDNGRRRRR
jgi:hypothetical protein